MSAPESGIIRTVKDPNHPYVMISKGLASDSRLSWEARGLMLYSTARQVMKLRESG